MWIELEDDADAPGLKRTLTGLGLWVERVQTQGSKRTAFHAKAGSSSVNPQHIRELPGVRDVFEAASPHPRVDALRNQRIRITPELEMGGGAPAVLMAGPCAVESEAQIRASAEMVRRAGARVLRGGAFKPRTSPYSFHGVGPKGLSWMRKAADDNGLAVVSEIMDVSDTGLFGELVDLIQIGSRNMQNYALLRAVGGMRRPVMLKRSASGTVQEWLLAAEHLLDAGAPGVVFCERGIRGFDPQTRNVLDLGAVALLKHVYGLAICVDPSHAVGRRELIAPLSKAAIAAGADALLIEAHPDSREALSDGAQALDGRTLRHLWEDS